MLRLAADENFNNSIVRALKNRIPNLDIVRIQDAGLAGVDDETILEWAAVEKRILLTHDVSTITHFAYQRIQTNRFMPGVFEIGCFVPITQLLDDMVLLCTCSHENEWNNQILYLPLK